MKPVNRFFPKNRSKVSSVKKSLCLNERNVLTEEILFTGDTLGDYYASSGAGLKFIGMSGRTATEEEFDKVGSNSVTNLTELREYLQKL